MAFRHGRNAQFFVGTTELTAYLDTADSSIDQDANETTVFGQNYRTYIAGLMGGQFSLGGSYDGTTSTGPIAALRAVQTGGTVWPMKYFPGGSASGQIQDSFSGFVTNVSYASSVDNKVTFTATVQASGTVTTSTL